MEVGLWVERAGTLGCGWTGRLRLALERFLGLYRARASTPHCCRVIGGRALDRLCSLQAGLAGPG